ncbi:MAG: hypothetical protein K2L37_00400, partial [Lactobacillus sp.]|nr:hypothetical protein [Lactobacillus sp.]
MEKRLKLIAFYDLLNVKFQRRFILSATTKLDYMISVLNRMGYSVDIISPAVAEGGMLALSKTETKQLGVNTLTTFGCISLPSKRLTRKVSGRQVFKKFKKYLFNTIKDGDYVIAYHSPRYAKTLADLRNERNFILIGEVEEIYQDVRSMGQAFNTEEYDFFEACDRFIFPTHLLDNKLNASNNKKSITIHGLYNVEPDRNVKFNDNKIHVVYAGTFDPQKGGAAAAVAATAFLPENYHIHICGFGNHAATEKIKEAIREIQNTAKATVSFDGMLKGEDFFQFIQKCEIGLST